jgi:hypothetical protein
MTALLANHDFAEKAMALSGATPVKDADGQIIGYFVPTQGEDAELVQRMAQQFDVAAFTARVERESGTGKTTSQVLSALPQTEPDA